MRRTIFNAVVVVICLNGLARAEPKWTVVWEHATPVHLPQGLAVSSDGKYLFVAMKKGGIDVLQINPSQQQRRVANIPLRQLGNLDAMNLERQGDRLYVALGGFFGRNSKAGMAIIDMKQPRKPKVLGTWQSKEVMEGAAIVAVKDKHAYLGAMFKGIITLDISKPGDIQHLSTVQPDIHFPQKNPGRIGKPNARGMAIAGKLLFLTNDAGGLRVMDLSNPALPRQISQYINEKMKKKQQAYNNIVIDGKYGYMAVDYAGLEIVDVSNPRRVHHVGWWNPWKADTNQNFWFNSPGHTNQLVFDRRHKRVLLSAGDAELEVVDVSNPQRPKRVAQFGKQGNGFGVWGLTASRGTAYLAYIKTFVPFHGKWSGIKAVRLNKQ